RIEYDVLRRPVRSFVRGADPDNSSKEICVEATIYGDALANAPAALNLRGRPLLHCDTAGVVIAADRNPQTGQDEAFDFKGNPLRTTRRLAREYKKTVDWNGVDWNAVETVLGADPFRLSDIFEPFSGLLEAEPLSSSLTYDALNRPVTIISPDTSV